MARGPADQPVGKKNCILTIFVMAGLVPAIHVLFPCQERRGCPA
jgi:hypothetical protein